MLRQAALVNILYGLQVGASFAVVVYISYLYGASRHVDIYFFALGIVVFHQTVFTNLISVRGILLWKAKRDHRFRSFVRNIAWMTACEAACAIALIGIFGNRLFGVSNEDMRLLVPSAAIVIGALPAITFLAIVNSVFDAELRFHRTYVYGIAQCALFLGLLSALIQYDIGPAIALSTAYLLSFIGVAGLVAAAERPTLRAIYSRMAARTESADGPVGKTDSFNLYFVLGTVGIASIPVLERMLAVGLGEGTVSALNYAYRIANIIGFGLSAGMSAVVLPLSLEAIGTKDRATVETFFARMYWILGALAAIVAVLAGVLLYYGDVVVRLIYFRGQFDDTALEQTRLGVIGYLGVLMNVALNAIAVKALFSLGRYRFSMALYMLAPLVYFTVAMTLLEKGVYGLASAMSIVFVGLLVLNVASLLTTRKY